MNFVFAGYKESYCVLEYNITCVAVNFYWSELDTLSGQIYCTLDIFGYCTVIYQRVDLLHFGHCPYLGADSTIVLTL